MSALERLLAALEASPEVRPGEAPQLVAARDAEVWREAAGKACTLTGPQYHAGTVGAVAAALDRVADGAEQGEKDTRSLGESTPQPAELTIYRASHESIVMGRYTTRAAAREHCETLMRREVGEDVFLGWVPDHGGEDAPEELCTGEDVECTGYVVTPLPVASEYDGEADE